MWEYTCSECGSRFKTDVPPEARTVFGSWLAAMIGVMTALGMTRRHIQTFFEQTADIDISQGGIQKCLDRVSLSIQPHYDAIARESRRVPVSHVDETSSRLFGPDGEEKHWLWVMVCPTLCFFMIHTTRSAQAFSDLVGDRAGILVSDGYAFYQKWAGVARQSCLSHLIRKARQFAESDTPEKASGGHWILAELRRLVKMAHNLPTKGQYLAWKGRFTRCVNKWWRSGHLCPYARHLLLEADYIVTFLKYKGIDPTNNAAEKALCPYVCHKKISFGATSLHGEDDIAKLLTIHETCRPNSRSSYAELKTALECYARGKSSTVNWI
ncbi:MAG: IS66 family transposase [Desulfovibrio sp.]|nr:IS66 family transposase [Desulfovibrio sp.]